MPVWADRRGFGETGSAAMSACADVGFRIAVLASTQVSSFGARSRAGWVGVRSVMALCRWATSRNYPWWRHSAVIAIAVIAIAVILLDVGGKRVVTAGDLMLVDDWLGKARVLL